MPLEYQRDIPANSTPEVIERTKEHVREHLAAIADADDNPETYRADVTVWVARHPDNHYLLRVEGRLEADANAPYLREDFDAFNGIDPELMKAAGLDG